MNPTAFRLLIVAALALQFGNAFVDMLFPSLLSPALAQAIEAEPMSPYLYRGWFMLLIVTWAVVLLVSIIGLLLLKRWARPMNLWVTVATWAIYPLLGPDASSGLQAALAEAGAMLWGAVLAVAYFSPLRARFGDVS